MTGELDTRLVRMKAELDDHARIGRYLGLDFERPVQSLREAGAATPHVSRVRPRSRRETDLKSSARNLARY